MGRRIRVTPAGEEATRADRTPQPRTDHGAPLRPVRVGQGQRPRAGGHPIRGGRWRACPLDHRTQFQYLGGDRIRVPPRDLGDERHPDAHVLQRDHAAERHDEPRGNVSRGLSAYAANADDGAVGVHRSGPGGDLDGDRQPGAATPGDRGRWRLTDRSTHAARGRSGTTSHLLAARRAADDGRPGNAVNRDRSDMMRAACRPRATPLSGVVAAFAVAALMSGCAVGPDFRRPAPPALLDYARPSLGMQTTSAEIAGGETQRFIRDRQLSERWWTVFESPTLNALIDKALKASPTLVAAEAALRQASALRLAQQGAFFPTITASFAASRQQTSATFSPPLSTPDFIYNLYTLQGTLSFTPDVFGANRRQVEALGSRRGPAL